MAIRTLAYECKFCGALKKSKNICEKHEVACFQNPDAKNCLLCSHMKQSDKGRICSVSGKRCSVAVSALCEDFLRKDSNE